MLVQKEKIEESILERISCGDEMAFASFYERFHGTIAYRAYRLLKNKPQAEDVVQEVFSKVWAQRASIVGIQDAEAYLSVLARNSCLNLLKANIRKQSLEARYAQDMLLEEDVFFEEGVSESERYRLLDRAIERLPRQQQKVYLLSRVDRKKYLDIASELEISRESVKKYLQLANQSIKSYLAKHKDSIVGIILFFSF